MSKIISFFSNTFTSSTKLHILEIISQNYVLQPKYTPIEIKKIVSTSNGKDNFIKQFSPKQKLSGSNNNAKGRNISKNIEVELVQQIKFLKKLCLFHHLVLYHIEFSELIEDLQLEQFVSSTEQGWFCLNIIKPYIYFLRKYCLGIQMYQKLRSMPNNSKQSVFQCMCYAVNIFKSLFSTVSKIQALGRYFRDKSPNSINYFVELISFHAQNIYQSFRSCISQILSFNTKFITSEYDQNILKQILLHDLPWINQEMKKVLLDKYFYPYGKGYGVKLYKLEEQNQYVTNIIHGIVNDHEHTNRRNQYKILEETLFPKGIQKFNHKQFEESFQKSLVNKQHFRKFRGPEAQKSMVSIPNPQVNSRKKNSITSQIHNQTLPQLQTYKGKYMVVNQQKQTPETKPRFCDIQQLQEYIEDV